MGWSRRFAGKAWAVGAGVSVGAVACAPPPPAPEIAPTPIASEAPVAPPPAPVSAAPPVAVAPPAPIMEPLADAPCRLRPGKSMPGTVRLTWKGTRFAAFENTREVELRVAGDKAIAAVATDDVEVVGETDPKAFAVVPTDEALIDGFIRPLRAHVESISGDQATVRFAAPRYVVPQARLAKTMPCSAIVLGHRPRPEKVGKPMDFRDGLKAPLVTTPGGPVVATIITNPKPKPTAKRTGWGSAPLEGFKLDGDVLELDRKGALVHVRIPGEGSEAEGFLPASALQKHSPPTGLFGLLGSLGSGAETKTERRVRCEQPVTIYVRRSKEITQIGRYKPNGLIVLPDPPKKNGAESDESPLSTGELRVTLGDAPTSIFGGLDDEAGLGGISGLGGIGLGTARGEGVALPPPHKAPPKPIAFVRAEAITTCAAAPAPPTPPKK